MMLLLNMLVTGEGKMPRKRMKDAAKNPSGNDAEFDAGKAEEEKQAGEEEGDEEEGEKSQEQTEKIPLHGERFRGIGRELGDEVWF